MREIYNKVSNSINLTPFDGAHLESKINLLWSWDATFRPASTGLAHIGMWLDPEDMQDQDP